MILLTKEKKQSVTELFVDGDLYREIDSTLFKKKLSCPKTFSSKDLLDAWFIELEYQAAKEYILFLLARRDYLKHKLEDKLKKRRVSLKTCEKLLSEFQFKGFIDDERLLVALVNRYREKKSRREILFLLKKEKVDIESFPKLLVLLSEEEEKKALITLVQKNRNKDRQKLFAYLYRKGFSHDLIKNVLED